MDMLLEKAAALPARRRKLIQDFAIRIMRWRRIITEEQAEELRLRDWSSFIEWLLEYAPQITQIIMMLIALF